MIFALSIVLGAWLGFDAVASAAPIIRIDSKTAGTAAVLSVQSLGITDRGDNGLEDLEVAVDAFRQGNLQAARDALLKAVEQNGDLPPADVMLARLLIVTGQSVQGRALLEQAAVDHAASPDVFLLMGEIARVEGRLSDAMLNFKQAMSLAAESSSEKIKADATLAIASIHEARGQWADAGTLLRAAIKLGADRSDVLVRLARVHFAADDIDMAEKLLRRANVQDPQSEPVEIVLGQWLHSSGQKESAARWVQAALQSHPQDRRVLSAAVLWALEVERFEDASGYVQRLATLATDDPSVMRMQGLVARFRGDLKSAETHFQRLLVDYPGDFLASNQLALILVESEQPAKQRRALQLAESTYRQYPQSLDARVSLGWIHHRLGNADLADNILLSLGTAANLEADSGYYVAKYYSESGNRESAVKLLRMIVSGRSVFANRKQAIELLASLEEIEPSVRSVDGAKVDGN